MPAENALRRLIAIQRRLGRITLADIKANYPIDAMSPGAIGRTMDRLEKAGIDIEFYKSLLRRRSDIGHTIRPADFRIRRAEVPPAPAVQAKSTSPLRQARSGRSRWWINHVRRLAIAILALAVLVGAILLAMRP